MTEQPRPFELTTTRATLEADVARACAEQGLDPASATVQVISETPDSLVVSLTSPDDQSLRLARETLAEMLVKMHLQAEVVAHWEMSDGERTLFLNVEGDDLSLLIGRKGETLSALQYILRLMLGRELTSGVNLVVDVGGHRQRRIEQLQRLAARMAEQAAQRQRTMLLEPMPANERRIVHLALRDHPDVRTESVGEGERRKITIIPKNL